MERVIKLITYCCYYYYYRQGTRRESLSRRGNSTRGIIIILQWGGRRSSSTITITSTTCNSYDIFTIWVSIINLFFQAINSKLNEKINKYMMVHDLIIYCRKKKMCDKNGQAFASGITTENLTLMLLSSSYVLIFYFFFIIIQMERNSIHTLYIMK